MSRKKNEECIDSDRRSILKLGAAASAVGILGVGCSSKPEEKLPKPATKSHIPSLKPLAPKAESTKKTSASKQSIVVRVSQKGMRKTLKPDPVASKRMINAALKTLTSKSEPETAWAQFVSADDKVAVKVNALGGPIAATQRVVADVIVDSIVAAGVPKSNVMIFDQFEGSMNKGGYKIVDKAGDVRVLSEKSLGYEAPQEVGSNTVKLAKALSWATIVINVPVLKEHPMCGTSGAIKNMVFGCIESPDFLHKNINEVLAEIYSSTQMQAKVKLNIMDASHVQYDGGPMYSSDARVQHDSIYVSTDPVAIDAIEWEVVERFRAEKGLQNLTDAGRPPEFLKLAQERGIGIAERKNIKLTEIELS